MQSFNNFEAFEKFIDSDIDRPDFNPIRLINVDTMPTWIKVKSFLSTKVNKIFTLSEFCADQDIAPNLNQLKKSVRLTEESALLIPLSEYLRINAPIAHKTLYDLLHANYCNIRSNKVRIYIPVYRMGDILKTVELNPKEQNCVLIIEETEESDYALTIVQNTLNFKNGGNDIDGFKKYFIYWEQNPDKPIILHTKTAVNYEDIIFSDNVKVIISTYDMLRYFGLPAEIKEDMGSDDKWNYWAPFVVENTDIDQKFATALRVFKYSDSLYKSWKTYNNNEKWLLWLWSHLRSKNEYLRGVLNNSDNFENFEKDILLSIRKYVGCNTYPAAYKARKDFIIDLNIKSSKEAVSEIIGNYSGSDAIRCLTDCSDYEKTVIFNKLSSISGNDMSVLEETYPMLANYLLPTENDNEFISEYLLEYKMSKAKNKASDRLIEMMQKNAEDSCYNIWGLTTRNCLVNELYDDECLVWFIDAFGAEYVSAFEKCFNSEKYVIITHYGHSNLPSITEYNNDFYADKNYIEPFYELDHLKHSKCEYPESIIQELKYVQDIAKKVVDVLSSRKVKKIIIAGDHGTSRFAFMNKGDQHSAGEQAKVYKYGRYCIDPVNSYSDIVGCIRQDDFWIFSNYDKFIQKGAPVCEVHGGASVEEMVVPIIEISLRDSKYIADTIIITLITPRVKVSQTQDVKIEFTLSKYLNNVAVSVNNIKYKCEYEEISNKYSFVQNIVDKQTEYKGKVIADGKIIGAIKYFVDRPVQKNNRFDI